MPASPGSAWSSRFASGLYNARTGATWVSRETDGGAVGATLTMQRFQIWQRTAISRLSLHEVTKGRCFCQELIAAAPARWRTFRSFR
jgi:hypothetical protein